MRGEKRIENFTPSCFVSHSKEDGSQPDHFSVKLKMVLEVVSDLEPLKLGFLPTSNVYLGSWEIPDHSFVYWGPVTLRVLYMFSFKIKERKQNHSLIFNYVVGMHT